MNLVLNSKSKLVLVAVILFLYSGILLLEHLQGGVIYHHILANEELPKISNWWGILSIPIISWFTLSLLQKMSKRSDNEQSRVLKSQIIGFICTFLFGILLTILFYNSMRILDYILLPTFVLALFIPLYLPQYYLGFILSMAYGFGGIIPVIFGLLLMAIYGIEYKVIRKGFLIVLNKIVS